MFSKLMKYDMKSGWRTWWIVSLVVAVATIISGPVVRFCAEYQERDWDSVFPIYSSIMFFVGFAYIMIVALSQYGLYIPLFIKFYKHLYTDEGYLTFTLPAKRSTILLSKTLSTCIYGTMYFVVMGLSWAFLALVVIPPEEQGQFFNTIFYTDLFELLKEGFELGYGGWIIAFAIEALLVAAGAWFFNIALVQFCITMGSVIAKKHKLLASVGIYFGTTAVISILSRILTFCVQIFLAGGTIEVLSNLTETSALWAVFLAIFGVIAAFATLGLAIYFTTLNLLERKLNLA